MANNNKHTGPNVPSLRFPEFSGEWESCTFGDVTNNFSRRNKERIQYPMFSVTNNRGFVPQSEQFEDREMVGEDIQAYKVIEKGDFAYNPARINVGSIAKYEGNEKCMISSLYVCFKVIDSIDRNWFMHLLKTPKMNFYYNLNGEGGVRVYLFYPNFARIRSSYPSLVEQKKIAAMLSLIDERIATQIKIIEGLTTLRSALYDSMFCLPEQETPKIRIPSFTENWQQCQLNEICNRKTTRNRDNTYSRVLTIAAQYGLVDQESFFKKRIASENLETYLCLEKGDFAYNKSYSSDYPWGAVKRLTDFENGIISPLYICFTPNPEVVDSDYLAHYFESTKWHSGISDISGEGARNHGLLNMSVIDYFNTLHRFPSLEEQKAIAQRLNAIDNKLRSEQEYMELLNRQKSSLLNQMFI